MRYLLGTSTFHMFCSLNCYPKIRKWPLSECKTASLSFETYSNSQKSISDFENQQIQEKQIMIEQNELITSLRKQKAVVIIDVTLNNALQQLIISELQPMEQQVGQHHDFGQSANGSAKLDTAAALDAFCAINSLSDDKRRKLEQVVQQQITKYY